MKRQEMSSILQELEKELSEENNLDHYHQQKTQALAEFIQQLLNNGDDKMTGDEFLVKKLKESIEEFEINHPKLTNIVGRVLDLLS